MIDLDKLEALLADGNVDEACPFCNAALELIAAMRERDRLRELVNHAYRTGYRDGVVDFAIWKDGKQVVGCMQRPLLDVLIEAEKRPLPEEFRQPTGE